MSFEFINYQVGGKFDRLPNGLTPVSGIGKINGRKMVCIISATVELLLDKTALEMIIRDMTRKQAFQLVEQDADRFMIGASYGL